MTDTAPTRYYMVVTHNNCKATEDKDGAWVCYTDYRTLERELARARAEVEQLNGLATKRHSVIAKAVYETVQDHAATWDDASDALIWDDPDADLQQKNRTVTSSWLDQVCVRFPQWAADLRSFAVRWNENDDPTEEELAAVEVSDEQVERGTRRAMQIMRFYDKLRKVEADNAALRARLEAAELDLHLEDYDDHEQEG